MTNLGSKNPQPGGQNVAPGQPSQQPIKVAQPGDRPPAQKPVQPAQAPDKDTKSKQ